MAVVATGSVALNEFKQLGWWYISPTENTIITMTAPTGDVDLYVRYAGPPELNLWDFRPYSGSSPEIVTAPPTNDRIYIAINGYEAGDYIVSIEPFIETDPTQLSPGEIVKIIFHLRMCNILFSPSQITPPEYGGATLIRTILASVEAAYLLTGLTAGTLLIEKLDETNQDIVTTTDRDGVITTTTYGDRLVTKSVRPSYQQRMTAYHKEVEKMAIALGIYG
jgi:ribosomal protein S11